MTIDNERIFGKETIKAIELKRGDMCIIKNKIYKITAIWFAPTLTANGLIIFALSYIANKMNLK